jgi:hypothetical protein
MFARLMALGIFPWILSPAMVPLSRLRSIILKIKIKLKGKWKDGWMDNRETKKI